MHSVFSSCYCDTATLCYLVGIYLDAIHIDWVERRRGKSLRAVHKVRQQFLGRGGSKIEEKMMTDRQKSDDMGRWVSKKANKGWRTLWTSLCLDVSIMCVLEAVAPCFSSQWTLLALLPTFIYLWWIVMSKEKPLMAASKVKVKG